MSQEGALARELPFVVRVAATWKHFAEEPGGGGLLFAKQSELTGEVVLTSNGSDVSFSDLAVGE